MNTTPPEKVQPEFRDLVIDQTRAQLNQAMAANAELSAMLTMAQQQTAALSEQVKTLEAQVRSRETEGTLVD